jgi:hypothetical protein
VALRTTCITCSSPCVTQADDVSIDLPPRRDGSTTAAAAAAAAAEVTASPAGAAGAAPVGAETTFAIDPSLHIECVAAAERVLQEGSGATLPLAWVQGFDARSSAGFRAALAALLADAAVVVFADGAQAGTPPSPARLILAAEISAYTSAGWRVVAARAWPVGSLPPTLLQSASPTGWLDLSSGEAYGDSTESAVAGDAVRIAVRNLGVLVSQAEGFQSDTGRWAENTISWLVDLWSTGRKA